MVTRALTGKLGFLEDRSGPHPVFERRHAGLVVGVTHLSHGSGGRDVSEGVLSAMARELGVSGPEFRRAVGCQLSAAAFLALLLGDST
jgi:hypothetical protein